MESLPNVTGPINLGNPEELTVLRVAQRIAALLGRAPNIAFKPLPVDDPKRRRPNIARAGAVLGWKPTRPLDRGLAQTIAYFRAQLMAGGNAKARAAQALPRDKIVPIGVARPAGA
jgi:UDP-glucuronate decarboxylase